MKQGVAKVCLVAAIGLFCTGFLVMCYCPELYAVAAGLAGIAAVLGAGRTKAWGVFWLVTSIVFTAVHVQSSARENERRREIRRWHEERRNAEEQNPVSFIRTVKDPETSQIELEEGCN